MNIRKLKHRIYFKKDYWTNHLVKKENRVLICEPWNLEANSIEVANYISMNYKMGVAYGVPKKLIGYAKKLVHPGVEVIDQYSFRFKVLYWKSKYIFSSHWKFPRYYTKEQVILNIWHGIPLKRIGLTRGSSGIPADLTLATSEITQKIFSDAFGVPLKSVVVAGYPRNDVMLRAKMDKLAIKSRLEGELNRFDKTIIWLPTFRTDLANNLVNGRPVNNPFQIDGFDADAFNKFLAERNVLCIVKPHPLDFHRNSAGAYSNIKVINDEWMLKQEITIYHLAACSDILVSDISSIILDYLLIDQPVLCFSTDFDEYKKDRGYTFDDIENWLPGKLLRDQAEFTAYLAGILSTGTDPWEAQRKKLKTAFFKYHDANSTKRLLEHVFNLEK